MRHLTRVISSDISSSPEPQRTGAGGDVEVADVTGGTVRGWTFAAFGPFATRRDELPASWQTLEAATYLYPEQFGSATGRAMGYPEWLAFTV